MERGDIIAALLADGPCATAVYMHAADEVELLREERDDAMREIGYAVGMDADDLDALTRQLRLAEATGLGISTASRLAVAGALRTLAYARDSAWSELERRDALEHEAARRGGMS